MLQIFIVLFQIFEEEHKSKKNLIFAVYYSRVNNNVNW